MAKYDNWKRLVLPLNIVKHYVTTSLGRYGVKTTAGPGNEGIELVEWINERIDDGDIDVGNGVQYRDEGTNIGTPTDIDFIDFTGSGVTASYSGGIITVNVAGGNGANLSYTASSTQGIVVSDSGTDATIPAVNATDAGLMTPTQRTNLNALISLSGVSGGSIHFGTLFTGSIIPDNSTIYGALQALETAVGTTLATGDLTSSTTAITVAGGTDVIIGAGTALTFVPGNVNLSSLGGTLNLSQLSTSGAVTGETIVFNGTTFEYTFANHNLLAGLQGGTTNEYYHLNSTLYQKLTNAIDDRLIGRVTTGSGEVELISVGGSVSLASSLLTLVNDSATPGNSKYYGTDGSGTKGFFTIPSTVSTVGVTDSADIDFTVTNPTTTPNITGVLTVTGVTAGTYGSASSIPVFSVDSKGRIISASPTAISITSSQVSNFNEAVDDQVAVLLQAGTNISLSYIDGSGTLTINATGASTEDIQDAIGNILVDSADIDFTYSDPTPSITGVLTTTGVTAGSYGSAFGSSYPTFTVDSKGRLTAAGNQLIQINTTQITNIEETIDDRVSNLLQAGANISLNYNDVSNTLTIAATGSTGYVTIQDDGTDETQRAILNFTGDGFVVGDDTPDSRTNVQLNANLQGYAILAGVGLVSKDAFGGTNAVEITAGTGIAVGNGDGILGDPTISLDHLGIQNLTDPNADRILFWDDSAGATAWLTIGSGLSITGTTISATGGGSLPAGTLGDFLYHNGTDWEAITPVRNDQTNNTGTVVTLPSTPITTAPIQVFLNGFLKTPVDDYSLSGTTLTFTFSLALTDKVSTFYYN